jgi:hypothetical protein
VSGRAAHDATVILPPIEPSNGASLADWLEMLAVASGDGNSSSGDLEAWLTRSGINSPEEIERALADAMTELAGRQQASAAGFPFDFDGAVLRLRRDAWRHRTTYLFAMALAARERDKSVGVVPERVFEDLAVGVAAAYVGGTAVRFGAPRETATLSPSIGRAVRDLCVTHIREGEARPSSKRSGDGGVDVVAWRPHADGRSGKLIMFGACATGRNWREKLRELDPEKWFDKWLARPLTKPIAKAFFIPFRISSDEAWADLIIEVGIPFDRCRMAALQPRLPDSTWGDGSAWARAILT